MPLPKCSYVIVPLKTTKLFILLSILAGLSVPLNARDGIEGTGTLGPSSLAGDTGPMADTARARLIAPFIPTSHTFGAAFIKDSDSLFQNDIVGDSKGYTSSYELDYTMLSPWLLFDIGLRRSSSVLDISGSLVLWPLFKHRLNIGPGVTLHERCWTGAFTEYDIVAGLWYCYKYKIFTLRGDLSYLGKWTDIKDIERSPQDLHNDSVAVRTSWAWTIPISKGIGSVTTYFGIGSYSKYSYMLMFSPEFSTGVEYSCPLGFIIGGEFKVQYIDLFMLSSYQAGREFSFYIKTRLPYGKS